jgi:hypothetical protein
MTKKFILFSALFLMLTASGLVLYGANYNVSGMVFNGVMVGSGDTDWLNLQGQEGVNPTICLRHGSGVDFDIAVYNNGSQVGSNLGLSNVTCVTARTPGSVRVKVWSVNGRGSYSVTIRR